MANATKECVGKKTSGIFVMKGHQDGVVSSADNFEAANLLIMNVYTKFALR